MRLYRKTYIINISENCEWNDFGAWTECDKDCGGGAQSRTRTVFKTEKFGGKPCDGEANEERKCNENPCAGRGH